MEDKMSRVFHVASFDYKRTIVTLLSVIVIILFLIQYYTHFQQQNNTGYSIKLQTNRHLMENEKKEIDDDTMIVQELPEIPDGIDCIRVRLSAAKGEKKGNIILQIQERKSGMVLVENIYPVKEIKRKSYVNISIDSLSSEKLKEELNLVITAGEDERTPVSVFRTTGDGIEGCSLTSGAQLLDGDLVIQYAAKTDPDYYGSACVLGVFAAISIVLIIVYRKKTQKKGCAIVCFLVLYMLLVLRTIGDSFTSYLWAEDGALLITDAIYTGAKSVVAPGNGAYWIIPKLIGLICYWMTIPFRSVRYLPLLQGLITKLIAAAGIGWFMSDRFNWVVKKRIYRFLICEGVVILMPPAADVLTCDTSLPFILNFTVFLIGLDLLGKKEVTVPTIMETVFLAAQALSTAAAPFAAAVAGCAWIRWLYDGIRKKKMNFCSVTVETLKFGVISSAAIIQIMTAYSGNRVGGSIQLFNRIKECIKVFPFFPFYQSLGSRRVMIICIICWVLILVWSKISFRIIAYCFLYSYCFLFYCSMTNPAENLVDILKISHKTNAVRYVILSAMIMSFLLLNVILCISKTVTGIIISAIMLCTMFPVIAGMYQVNVEGAELAAIYDQNSDNYCINSNDNLMIPIGPICTWKAMIPVNIEGRLTDSGVEGEVYRIDGQHPDQLIHIAPESSTVTIYGYLKDESGEPFDNVFLKVGEHSYLAGLVGNDDGILSADRTIEQRYSFVFYGGRDLFQDGITQLEVIGKKQTEHVQKKFLK